MPLEAREIKCLIKEAMPDALVELEDLRGDGEHYAAYVESAYFDGLSRLDQHRMVFKALRGHMGTSFETIMLKTALPANSNFVRAG